MDEMLAAGATNNNSNVDGEKVRRGSFKGTSFERLAQTENEEQDLEHFFSREKIFIVFSNAGKPVYSR